MGVDRKAEGDYVSIGDMDRDRRGHVVRRGCDHLLGMGYVQMQFNNRIQHKHHRLFVKLYGLKICDIPLYSLTLILLSYSLLIAI